MHSFPLSCVARSILPLVSEVNWSRTRSSGKFRGGIVAGPPPAILRVRSADAAGEAANGTSQTISAAMADLAAVRKRGIEARKDVVTTGGRFEARRFVRAANVSGIDNRLEVWVEEQSK